MLIPRSRLLRPLAEVKISAIAQAQKLHKLLGAQGNWERGFALVRDGEVACCARGQVQRAQDLQLTEPYFRATPTARNLNARLLTRAEEPNAIGFGVQGSGFRVQGSGSRVQGSGYRVQGSGLRIQGLGSRVQG